MIYSLHYALPYTGRKARSDSNDRGKENMPQSMIHPTAIIDPHAEIGPGVKIGPYAVIGPHVKLEQELKSWLTLPSTDGRRLAKIADFPKLFYRIGTAGFEISW